MLLLVCTFLCHAMTPETTNRDRTTAKVNTSTSAFPVVCWSTACEDAGQLGEHESGGGPEAVEGSNCRFAAMDTANQGKATTIVARSANCTACLIG